MCRGLPDKTLCLFPFPKAIPAITIGFFFQNQRANLPIPFFPVKWQGFAGPAGCVGCGCFTAIERWQSCCTAALNPHAGRGWRAQRDWVWTDLGSWCGSTAEEGEVEPGNRGTSAPRSPEDLAGLGSYLWSLLHMTQAACCEITFLSRSKQPTKPKGCSTTAQTI